MATCTQEMYRTIAKWSCEENPDAIFEYGCGYGFLLKEIYECGYKGKLYGADFSQSQIHRAKNYFSSATYWKCDIKNIPCEDKKFGLVIGVSVLMYLSPLQLEEVLTELKRVAERIICVEYEFNELTESQKICYQSALDGRYVHDYKKHLAKVGFRVIKTGRFEQYWDPSKNPSGEAGFSYFIGSA